LKAPCDVDFVGIRVTEAVVLEASLELTALLYGLLLPIAFVNLEEECVKSLSVHNHLLEGLHVLCYQLLDQPPLMGLWVLRRKREPKRCYRAFITLQSRASRDIVPDDGSLLRNLLASPTVDLAKC